MDLEIEAPAPSAAAAAGPKRPSAAYLTDSVVCVAAETASPKPKREK